MSRILIRRGNKGDLPVLAAGEPGIALDEKRLYFGTSSGNVAVPRSTQDPWTAPTLLNGWVNYGGSFANASYKKTDTGDVIIQGMIKSGTVTSGTVLFTLPAGFRPAGTLPIGTLTNTGTVIQVTEVDINPNGNVSIAGSNTGNTYLSLNGIRFPAEQ